MADNRVIVIPAGLAWEEYQECDAYVCQDRRNFQPSKRLAFYVKGEIKPQIPEILAVFDSVFFPDPEKDEKFEPEKHILLPSGKKSLDDSTRQHLVKVVDYWGKKRNEYGRNFKVFLLSPYIKDKISTPGEHNHTWVRSDSIKHNPEGKMTAFVQRQRYVKFDSLKKLKLLPRLRMRRNSKQKDSATSCTPILEAVCNRPSRTYRNRIVVQLGRAPLLIVTQTLNSADAGARPFIFSTGS